MGGAVFGTSWSLTYTNASEVVDPTAVRAEIESVFELVNSSMNHYQPTSLISRFNALPADAPVEVDWDFAYVLSTALTLNEATGGAYDVTVSALSELWGFGPEGPTRFPTPLAVTDAMRSVGGEQLSWQPEVRLLAKKVPGLALDFSSLAKGYAVDLGADALDEAGVAQYMLEIGGEVRVRGLSPRGDAWRIAVESPLAETRGAVQAALAVTDVGIATSGDYRNFFEHEGRRYSHLINPLTGYPIQHDLVSVTVVHGSAMMADAWATALTVMGSTEALAVAEQRDLAVYLLRRSGNELETLTSSSMTQWIEAAAP
jgi:thiamine biosynthesis lipoprotein